jgi:hypothetical protein
MPTPLTDMLRKPVCPLSTRIRLYAGVRVRPHMIPGSCDDRDIDGRLFGAELFEGRPIRESPELVAGLEARG